MREIKALRSNAQEKGGGMKLEYTYFQSGKFFIGRLTKYPGFPTQGIGLEDLEENLRDIYEMIQNGELEAEEIKNGVLEIAV